MLAYQRASSICAVLACATLIATVHAATTYGPGVQVLKQCGGDLSRENVMRQAAGLRRIELPMLLPGIHVDTSARDYMPVSQVQLMRFDGTKWVRFGAILPTGLD